MYSNTDNIDWHSKHGGARVPINDTLSNGAPFALSGANKSWAQGSVGNAVVATHNINNPDNLYPISTSTDLLGLAPFVNKSMLYGLSADARYRYPGDMMSYRAYPTAIVADRTLTVDLASSTNELDYEGNVIGAGAFTILKHYVSIEFKLPYVFEYTITINDGTSDIHTVDLRLEYGASSTNSYKRINLDLTEEWVNVPNSFIYFSVDTSGYSGDITYTSTITNVIQVPYYGDLGQESIIVPEVDYDPVAPTGYTLLGTYSDLTYSLVPIKCLAITCNEAPIGNFVDTLQLFIGDGDTIQLGTPIYSDNVGTPATIGTYVQSVFAYISDDGIQINVITIFIELDANGVIIRVFDPPVGFEGSHCWANNTCR